MRTQLSLLLALSLSTFAAHAGTAEVIKLDNQKTTGNLVSGTCGTATVKVTDASKDPDSPMDATGFSARYTAISVQSGKASLKISPDPESGSVVFLQDRNKLHCVSTPTGPKLLLSMICYARSCATLDYRVIDPATAKVISKQDNMEECDAVCARKALGVPVPAGLDDV